MITFAWIVGFLFILGILTYHRLPLPVSTLIAACYLLLASLTNTLAPGPLALIWILFLVITVCLNVPPIRRNLISNRLLCRFRKMLPPISDTERAALEAGTIWWDGELFCGNPTWKKLLSYPRPQPSAEEQAFLDGPVQELCDMLDDWDITHNRYDLPYDAWQFIKDNGFIGLIIPKKYGGLGFSAIAHSEIVSKIATRSTTAAVTVMVPNSLGPAELLLHYGTEAQRSHYLPRLATGQEIPCFALTNPEAGSDASSMPDTGIVCKGQWEGKEAIGLRLNWEKRYITLAPVATLLGLAFKVYDPDHLLSAEEDRGITLALIPTSMPGVEIGHRHLPLNIPFMNGPTLGKDVFIPLDYIIGGEKMIGHGWKMLMNCLSVGRSISLPASSTASAKFVSMVAGAYARVRQQFKVPIGAFEGIQDVLARIGGNTYLMDAARRMTAGAVDLGEKPAVLSAVVKYHLTERSRGLINAAMDIHGGKAICLGPSNYLGNAYQGIPVSITVEGANILTRSMIIFGQGAIRCHPYLLKEMNAAQTEDRAQGARHFDQALFGHIGFLIGNLTRAFWLGVTDGRLSKTAGAHETKRYVQQMNRMSAAFALVADIALLLLGGELKRKESLSGRLGDLLSYLYLGSATLKRYEDEGRQHDDLPLLEWAMQDTLCKLQETLNETLRNFPNKAVARVLWALIFPTGRQYALPSDLLGQRVAKILMEPGPGRDRLTAGVYRDRKPSDPVNKLESAFISIIAADPIEKKIQHAIRSGMISVSLAADRIQAALDANIITAEEANTVYKAQHTRRAAIMVDDFPPAAFRARAFANSSPGSELSLAETESKTTRLPRRPSPS